jgi:hypothetical protein
MFNNVFPKIVPFMRYVKKYGTARHTTDDNIIRRMHFAYWITKATDTHSEYAIHGNNGYANAPQYYLCTYIACLVKLLFNKVTFLSTALI